MAKRQVQEVAEVLNVQVSFGNLSIGDTTAKVGFTISRNEMTLDQAEEALCGKRLTGQLVVTAGGDDPSQKPLPGMRVGHRIAATFDCKAFRVSPKLITSGATLLLSSVDVSELGHFAKKQGRLIVNEIGEADGSDGEDDSDGDGDEG